MKGIIIILSQHVHFLFAVAIERDPVYSGNSKYKNLTDILKLDKGSPHLGAGVPTKQGKAPECLMSTDYRCRKKELTIGQQVDNIIWSKPI